MNTQPGMAVFHFQEWMALPTKVMGKKFAKTPKGCEK